MKFSFNFFLFIFSIFSSAVLLAGNKSPQERLEEANKNISENSAKIAGFYALAKGIDCREITQDILDSAETKEALKYLINNTRRRFFLFQNLSGGFLVKGTISFVPDPTGRPLLVFLRGGNRLFGLMHPASAFTCMRDYTVIATTYRGGVSEGVDEYGGDEVSDIQNLIEYIPDLEQKLGFQFGRGHTYMLGGGRGGMEMFLALGRSPFLQDKVTKVASLRGHLDIRECMRFREDMRSMFIEDFGLIPEENEEEWIDRRNPIAMVPKLKKDLPILIIQGAEDIRVSPLEGLNMVKKLKEHGNNVEYIEVPDIEQVRVEMIADWFESER